MSKLQKALQNGGEIEEKSQKIGLEWPLSRFAKVEKTSLLKLAKIKTVRGLGGILNLMGTPCLGFKP